MPTRGYKTKFSTATPLPFDLSNTKTAPDNLPSEFLTMPSRNKKVRNARDNSTTTPGPSRRTRSKTELAAVPARSFSRFRDLPLEIRRMIWDFAMPETFIEARCRPDTGQFQLSSKSSAFKSSISKPNLLPIYLKPTQWMMPYDQRHRMVNGVFVDPPVEPIYIQSGDVVYIPEVWTLDANAFLKREENQVIEHLAIPASQALSIGPVPIMRETEVSKVVRGLKKLKSLYILDGPKFGSEKPPRYEGQEYIFSWSKVKVKQGPELCDLPASLNLTSALLHPGQYNWDTGLAKATARSIIRAAKRITENGERWDPPQLIFRELKRTLVK